MKPCPICGGRGERDAPQLPVCDAVCTVCGWYYSSDATRAELELELDAEVELAKARAEGRDVE